MANHARVDENKSWRLLREKMLALVQSDENFITRIPGFVLHRFDTESTPRPHMYKPVIVVVVQGSKWARIGEDEQVYGQSTCFVSGVDMPITSCIRDASPEKPYLSLSMDLDNSLITRMAAEIAPELPPEETTPKARQFRRWTRNCWMPFYAWSNWSNRPAGRQSWPRCFSGKFITAC